MLRGRRAKPVDPEPSPEPVLTVRATVVGARPLPDPERWLGTGDLEDRAGDAVGVLNAVLQAQRIAAADPFAREVELDQALVVRVGIGRGRAGRRRPLERRP